MTKRAKPARSAELAPGLLSGAEALYTQAADAALAADAKTAEAAAKAGERLASVASGLGGADEEDEDADLEAERLALLERIDAALEGARQARRLEVEALTAAGFDPREAWFWDAVDDDWVWNPSAVFGRAAQQTARRMEAAIKDPADRESEDDAGTDATGA